MSDPACIACDDFPCSCAKPNELPYLRKSLAAVTKERDELAALLQRWCRTDDVIESGGSVSAKGMALYGETDRALAAIGKAKP